MHDLDYGQTEKKVNVLVNMEKQVGRKELENLEKLKNKNVDLDFAGNDVIVDINVDPTKPKVKTLVAYRQPSKKSGDQNSVISNPNSFQKR